MMEYVDVISQLGFPIAVVLLLMWYINNTQTKLIEQITEIAKQIALLVTLTKKEDDNDK